MNTASTSSQDSAVPPNSIPRPANQTRRTKDLVAKFKREGRWGLIPIYHLMRLSDFGREGIEHSGSFRFADHLYRSIPSGRGLLGRLMDRVLLSLPAAKAMRRRYLHAMDQIEYLIETRPGPLRILAIPCGLPRDIAEVLERYPADASRVEYVGMDLDPAVIEAARDFLRPSHVEYPNLMQGNALDATTWPEGKFDLIISTGLGEFLTDEALCQFYRNAHQALRPGGIFYTSATALEPRADYLLRAFELQTQYRSMEELRQRLDTVAWSNVTLRQDRSGLQTFATACKSKD